MGKVSKENFKNMALEMSRANSADLPQRYGSSLIS